MMQFRLVLHYVRGWRQVVVEMLGVFFGLLQEFLNQSFYYLLLFIFWGI